MNKAILMGRLTADPEIKQEVEENANSVEFDEQEETVDGAEKVPEFMK